MWYGSVVIYSDSVAFSTFFLFFFLNYMDIRRDEFNLRRRRRRAEWRESNPKSFHGNRMLLPKIFKFGSSWLSSINLEKGNRINLKHDSVKCHFFFWNKENLIREEYLVHILWIIISREERGIVDGMNKLLGNLGKGSWSRGSIKESSLFFYLCINRG